MKTLKFTISIIIVLSMLSYIVISACSECGIGSPEDVSYTSLGSEKHRVDCAHCPATWEEYHSHVWQHEGIGWDDFNNKFHEFTCSCGECGEFLEFGRVECTGPGCILCAIWGN